MEKDEDIGLQHCWRSGYKIRTHRDWKNNVLPESTQHYVGGGGGHSYSLFCNGASSMYRAMATVNRQARNKSNQVITLSIVAERDCEPSWVEPGLGGKHGVVKNRSKITLVLGST